MLNDDNRKYGTCGMKGGIFVQPTLEEILQLKCLENGKMITHNYDVNRKVEFIDVMEVPDVFCWIRPNTFLLTAAYAIKDDIEAQVNLISKLSELKVTALAIKPERFMGKIPDIMIEQANKLNFPLIELSSDVLYSDVISGISELIFSKKTGKLQKTLDVNNVFKKVVMKGGSFAEIAEELSAITKKPILIEDSDFNILGYENITKEVQIKDNLYAEIVFSGERHKLMLKSKDSNVPILYKVNNKWVYAFLPIRIQEECLGYITMFKGNKHSALNITAMKHAAFAAALKLDRIKSYHNREILIKNQLIYKLLSDDNKFNKSLRNQINHFGWPINQHYISIAIRPETDKEPSLETIEGENIHFRKLMQILGNKLCLDDRKVINYVDDQNILFFISLSNEEVKDYKKYVSTFIDNVIEKGNQFAVNLYIGIGIPVKNIYEIKLSYQKSVAAIEMDKKNYIRKKVIFYDELDFYEIIINYEPKSKLNDFCSKYIGPLINSEENDPNSDLIHTLEVYFDSGCSLVKASQALYIHRNTLIYRLDKIKKILTYNLDDPEVHFKINFAIKTYKYLK